jgi:hypothetical protein
MWGRSPDDHRDDRYSGISLFTSTWTRQNNSFRMFSLFPKVLLGPLLNSNVESSPLKKGYVMAFLFYGLTILNFAGSYHLIEWLVCQPLGSSTLTFYTAYNAFVSHGKSSSWCKSHALSFRALSRAVSIRAQLKKYMQRFDVSIESCQGDAKRLRQCLVNGYKQNGARWVADGTYRSIRGNTVSLLQNLLKSPFSRHGRCYMFTPILLSLQENRLRAGLSSTT